MKLNFLSSAFLAQLSHVLAGAVSVAYIWIFAPHGHLPWLPIGWLPFLVLLLELGVLGKESLLDPILEHDPPQPFFWEGVTDWAFWQPGIALTWIVLILAHKPL